MPKAAAERLAAAGAAEEAVEASVIAANGLWRGGRIAEGESVLDGAWSLVDGRTESPALAALAAEAGRFAAFAGRFDDAETLCRRAIEAAGRLGLDDVRAQALNTSAVTAMVGGDLRRAIALCAEVIDSAAGTSERNRALTNSAVVWYSDLFCGKAEELGRASIALAERTGDRGQALWTRSGEIENELLAKGAWDEALEGARAFLVETAAVGGHALDTSMQMFCALILAYRGDGAGALEFVEPALERVDFANAQAAIPLLLHSAEVLIELGDVARAKELVTVALGAIERAGRRTVGATAANAATVFRAGLSERWLDLFETRFVPTGRAWAARLIQVGRADDAAELYGHGGSAYEEASARLLAFEQLLAEGRRADADVQLEQALVFYRRAGATSIVARGSRHLAAAS